jgi:hypothetical protein
MASAPSFVLFQGRLLGTAHIITLAPPRADGGKHIIEARVTGGVSYIEAYHDPDEAAGRYLALASSLLGDPAIAAGVQATPLEAQPEPELAPVTALPQRTALL